MTRVKAERTNAGPNRQPHAQAAAPAFTARTLARRMGNPRARRSGNRAVDAAFRAVARDEAGGERLRIGRADVLLAVGREYQKLGRPVTRAEFGEGYEIVISTLFTGAPSGAGGDREA
jgi:hypothetical protein